MKGISSPSLLSQNPKKEGRYLALAQRPAGTQSQTAAKWYISATKSFGVAERAKIVVA
jgi:hypothetical protein